MIECVDYLSLKRLKYQTNALVLCLEYVPGICVWIACVLNSFIGGIGSRKQYEQWQIPAQGNIWPIGVDTRPFKQ